MAGKYSCYVGIIHTGNVVKYVTKINGVNKVAMWEDGKEAMKLSAHAAEDLVFGLSCNGFQAVVVKAPNHLELSNP